MPTIQDKTQSGKRSEMGNQSNEREGRLSAGQEGKAFWLDDELDLAMSNI